MTKKIKVVLLGGFFHNKTVDITDDGDPIIECVPQFPAVGPTWVYKIASDAELAAAGLHNLTTVRGKRWAMLVGTK